MKTIARSGLALLTCMSFTAVAQTYFAGTVVDSNNQPLAGATVQAGHMTFPIWGDFISDGQATSDAQGHYAIDTLGAGDGTGKYVLLAQSDGRIGEVYPNNPCINLCPGNLPSTFAPPLLTVNFQLFHPASLTGAVTRASSHAAVPGARVALVPLNGPAEYSAAADAAGQFKMANVLPGDYRLSVQGYAAAADQKALLPQVYAGRDYDITLPLPDGDVVHLGDGADLTGMDFSVNAGGSIGGTITSAINGAPLHSTAYIRRLTPVDSGAYVQGGVSGGYSDPVWGPYSIGPLAPGTFKVEFGGGAFLQQFYPDATSEGQAQALAISGVQAISGIDAHITPLQTIGGTAYDAVSGQPLAGALVHAGPIYFPISLDEADAVTDAAGHYLLQGLDPTTADRRFDYYVWIYSFPGYLNTFYPNAVAGCCPYVGAGAQTVTLAASQQLTGIDIALSPGAYASGRIYDPDTGYSAPAGMQVDVLDANSNVVGTTRTDATGRYVTDAVPTGTYYLVAFPPNAKVFYPDYACAGTPCQVGHAELLDFNTNRLYGNLDFAIVHLDRVFRDGFE